MWRKMIELEQQIKEMRVALVKEYMTSQGVDISQLSTDDLLGIYSCMTVKVKKGVGKLWLGMTWKNRLLKINGIKSTLRSPDIDSTKATNILTIKKFAE